MRMLLVGCLFVVTGCVQASLKVHSSGRTREVPLFPSTTLTVEIFNKCAPRGSLSIPDAVEGDTILYNRRAVARFRPNIFDNNDAVGFTFEPFGDQYEFEVVQQKFSMRDFTNNKASWVIEREEGNVRSGRRVRCKSRRMQIK